MERKIQNNEAIENIYQNQLYGFGQQDQNTQLQVPHCRNQFYELSKQKITLQIQKINFSSYTSLRQLSADRFLIEIKRSRIRGTFTTEQKNPAIQPPNRQAQRNRRGRPVPRQTQITNFINPNNNNHNLNNFVVQAHQHRNIPRGIMHRRIGYIQSDEEEVMNQFHGDRDMLFFYINRDGDIINRMAFAVGNSHRVNKFSDHQILLQITETTSVRMRMTKVLTIIKVDFLAKKRIEVYKSQQGFKVKQTLYFPQTKLLCVIEMYKETIISYAKIRFFQSYTQEMDPPIQFCFQIQGYEQNFTYSKGNNKEMVVWFMRDLMPKNDYIEFYYKSNKNQNTFPQRIIIEKPQFMKNQQSFLESVLDAGQNSNKFVLFFTMKKRLLVFIYQVANRIFRQLKLQIPQNDRIQRIQPIVEFITRITTKYSVYYLDNLSQRIVCQDPIHLNLNNDQQFNYFFQVDDYNQINYLQQSCCFQVKNTTIKKNSLFALVYLLQQLIIDAHKSKNLENMSNMSNQNQEQKTYLMFNQNNKYNSENYYNLVDSDLIYETMTLLGLIQI